MDHQDTKGTKWSAFFPNRREFKKLFLVRKRVSQSAPLLVFFVSLWFIPMLPFDPLAAPVVDVRLG